MQKILIAIGVVILVIIGGVFISFQSPASSGVSQGNQEQVGASSYDQYGTDEDSDSTDMDDYSDDAVTTQINTQVSTQVSKSTVTPKPAPTKPSGITMAIVGTHDTASSCWTVVNGSVYDITAWISRHPGGSGAIVSMCGKDASAAFGDQHGGQRRPEQELASFKIGVLAQ